MPKKEMLSSIQIGIFHFERWGEPPDDRQYKGHEGEVIKIYFSRWPIVTVTVKEFCEYINTLLGAGYL